ncbi:galactosyldiacylglycerol synthase [Streptomyces sp. NPDC047108]|uniref:MGDG synthase family glycosyltransferase n=1 Tax=Streptomyces sp. NPDC047108 TaxID=3155025 RepID=UPI00340F3C1B
MERRFVVLSASMGAGHDAVARELARRLRDLGHDVLVQDVLALLPPGTGPALRSFYRASVRHAPRVYAGIYATFLAPGPGPRPGSSPLAALAERRLAEVVRRWRADAVVSTFHLAAQITGRMRERGTLRVPSAVVVIDFAVHRGWLHPGNDLHLCLTEAAATTARQATGRAATVAGPVVPPQFGAVGGGASSGPWRTTFARRARGHTPVLLSAGAWGVGTGLRPTAQALAHDAYLPVLLCGRDERLRHRAAALHGVLALGWVRDMPGLMSACRVLVDNAAGQTAVQALAAGLPVIGYRPIPGHGTEGVREMTAAGLSAYASDPGELLAEVGRLAQDGPERSRSIARGRTAFAADPIVPITELAASPAAPGNTGRTV